MRSHDYFDALSDRKHFPPTAATENSINEVLLTLNSANYIAENLIRNILLMLPKGSLVQCKVEGGATCTYLFLIALILGIVNVNRRRYMPVDVATNYQVTPQRHDS